MKVFSAVFVGINLAFIALPLSAQVILNSSPTRVVGQDSLTITGFTPNLVEGRELDAPLGLALDFSATPPHLYVADTGNNRILAWANAASFSNGQKADLVIGQPDLITTFAQGPGRDATPRTTGLASPVGVAVDGNGSLYVADCGNNRILRFPKPFNQTSIFPDIVLGQRDFTTNASNLITIGANTLNLNPGSPFAAYIAFDSSGNLWVTDPGNDRVLRFNASILAGSSSGGSADVVLGQASFTTSSITGYTNASLNLVESPTGIAFDNEGNLFVSESVGNQLGRVLVFTPPFASGQAATRLVGSPATAPATAINASQIGPASGGLAVVNDGLVVADTYYSRLLFYAPLNQWSPDTSTQPAIAVLGQNDLISGQANNGQPESGPTTLHGPADVAFSGAELFVADSGNNRTIVLPFSSGAFGGATRVLGQDAMNFSTVNLIEGRELRLTTTVNGATAADAGIAIDTTSTPAHLYISDTYNNRVLGFKNIATARAGAAADIVIGQPDFQHSEINYPANSSASPNQSGLSAPIGLAVDQTGNLYVADAGNGRVLRFPQPFASPQNLPNADIVLGQTSFTLTITDPSPSTMAAPYGISFAGDNGLLVSDVEDNRVLFFAGSSGALQTGMPASKVFGQPDFTTISAGSTSDKFSSPHHISTDSQNRLYVADTGNSRVSIFDDALNAQPDPQAALVIPGFNTPLGVFVNPVTNEIWVADTNNEKAVRFPDFDNLTLNGLQSNAVLNESSPLTLAQDASGALYVADIANRVVMHYAGVAGINAANFLTGRALAPGTIVSLYSLSGIPNYFGATTMNFNQLPNPLPIPTTLADTQVTVNDLPVPLYFVSPGQINFLMPNAAPTSGSVTINVLQGSTGQVLGSSLVEMNAAAPGLFTLPADGSGQVAAINQDGTVNGPSHPAPWGSVVAFFGTGLGNVAGAPPDGTPAAGPVPSSSMPQVVIGSAFVPAASVTYSGLAPGLVGVWQVNVTIPNSVPPTTSGAPTPVFFLLDSIPTGGPAFGRAVTMWVSQN